MGIAAISFTQKGMEQSIRIAEAFSRKEIEIFTKCSRAKEGGLFRGINYVEESIGEWTKKQMGERHTLLFIGACGIAVRAISPCITNKLQDSPVLVMDEKGVYVIPLLSGHVGGANEIAARISAKTGAIAVITTATDIHHKFAVDLFAKRNGLYIENKEGIAKVSAKVLAQQKITMAVDQGHRKKEMKIPEGILLVEDQKKEGSKADVVITAKAEVKGELLTLRPKEYILGIGCKRGKEEEKLREFILKKLEESGICVEQIMAVASIDRKKNEEGLVSWCRKQKIPFWTYTAEQLQQVRGEFSHSAFVKSQVGVESVCERAALRACQYGGKLVEKKYAQEGMTIAIAKREWRISFDEE